MKQRISIHYVLKRDKLISKEHIFQWNYNYAFYQLQIFLCAVKVKWKCSEKLCFAFVIMLLCCQIYVQWYIFSQIEEEKGVAGWWRRRQRQLAVDEMLMIMVVGFVLKRKEGRKKKKNKRGGALSFLPLSRVVSFILFFYFFLKRVCHVAHLNWSMLYNINASMVHKWDPFKNLCTTSYDTFLIIYSEPSHTWFFYGPHWRWEKTQEGGVELCFQKLLLLTLWKLFPGSESDRVQSLTWVQSLNAADR